MDGSRFLGGGFSLEFLSHSKTMLVILPESGMFSERIINTDFIAKSSVSTDNYGNKTATIVFSGHVDNAVIDMNQYGILKEYIIKNQTNVVNDKERYKAVQC